MYSDSGVGISTVAESGMIACAQSVPMIINDTTKNKRTFLIFATFITGNDIYKMQDNPLYNRGILEQFYHFCGKLRKKPNEKSLFPVFPQKRRF